MSKPIGRTRIHVLLPLALLIAAASTNACAAGGGACIANMNSDPVVYSACLDGDTQDECSAQMNSWNTAVYHAGKTCAALGYTLQCPGDISNTYRLPAYAPCP